MLSRKILQATPSPETDLGAGIVVTVLVLSVAVILSASIYLLLRLLRRYRHRSSSTSVNYEHHRPVNIRQVLPVEKNNPMIEALPLFTFNSIAGGVNGGDCAVCLSKFEPEDLLRLLPVCCHAFHAECIDTWFGLNHSCPLCRSPIFVSDAELIAKFSLLSQSSISSSLASSSRSFRVEIGNVSRRVPNSGEIRRSYSIGDAFDYFVDEGINAEVPAGSFRIQTELKVEPTAPPLEEIEALAAEVGPRGGWLTEYLSCSSRVPSFRGSGRWFFTGSSRRSEQQQQNREAELDVEASELSDNIGEYFRWLSGV